MPRPDLTYISVYMSKPELAVLQEAAERDNRSLSNYLLTAGLERAEELGLKPRKAERPKRGKPRRA